MISRCYGATVTQDGRRFTLVLASYQYAKEGVAIFHEVTLENSSDGEPHHDIFEDVGTWAIVPDRDVEGECGPVATPSILTVDCVLPDDVARAAVMNALLVQFRGVVPADEVALW